MGAWLVNFLHFHNMTIHARYTFLKQKDGVWTPVELEEVQMGDVVRFYDNGQLTHNLDDRCTDWTVDDRMLTFVQGLIAHTVSAAVLPQILTTDDDVKPGSYKAVFTWIHHRMQDGNIDRLNDLYKSFNPELHSATFMVGVLRCGFSVRHLLPDWLPTLRLAISALPEDHRNVTCGMDPDKIEQELNANRPGSDPDSRMFARDILNMHPKLIE